MHQRAHQRSTPRWYSSVFRSSSFAFAIRWPSSDSKRMTASATRFPAMMYCVSFRRHHLLILGRRQILFTFDAILIGLFHRALRVYSSK